MYPHPNNYTDAELFLGLRNRDEEIISHISREYRPIIRLLIHRMGGSTEDFKDIYQEGLAVLINMADDPDFILRSSVKTLLYAVCRNQWKYRLREQKRKVPIHQIDVDPAIHPDFDENSDLAFYEQLYWNIYQSLPLTCRNILLLYFREFSNLKIAAVLKVKEGYIKKRKSLCKRTLIEKLTAHSEFRRLRNIDTEKI